MFEMCSDNTCINSNSRKTLQSWRRTSCQASKDRRGCWKRRDRESYYSVTSWGRVAYSYYCTVLLLDLKMWIAMLLFSSHLWVFEYSLISLTKYSNEIEKQNSIFFEREITDNFESLWWTHSHPHFILFLSFSLLFFKEDNVVAFYIHIHSPHLITLSNIFHHEIQIHWSFCFVVGSCHCESVGSFSSWKIRVETQWTSHWSPSQHFRHHS